MKTFDPLRGPKAVKLPPEASMRTMEHSPQSPKKGLWFFQMRATGPVLSQEPFAHVHCWIDLHVVLIGTCRFDVIGLTYIRDPYAIADEMGFQIQ
jgi:hypothetical protein